MILKFKKLHEDAIIPSYAKPGDAGLDLTAVTESWDNDIVTYGTGLAMEIPEGFVGLLTPRSSVYKTGLFLANSVGVIDSGYRGEIMFKYRSLDSGLEYHISGLEYHIKDRVGQLLLVPIPLIKTLEVDELSSTDRGEGGFGSTGN
jgi:dUTP pyrophosphatase